MGQIRSETVSGIYLFLLDTAFNTHLLFLTLLPVLHVNLRGLDKRSLRGSHLFQGDPGNLEYRVVQVFPGEKFK